MGDHQLWSYGCKESGMSFLNAGSFDPNDPLGGLKQQQFGVDKCCVERDICKQTCGMTSKACHDNFQKCSQKTCKGNQNCQLQAMMSEIMSEPYDPDEYKDPDKKYDPEESKCKGYKRSQEEACQCVVADSWQNTTEEKLKGFYGKYNPEKLDKNGDIKDVAEVWKKWKGKEPDMFLALATKYKQKAVEIRIKPKPPPPPPYKPPSADGEPEDSTEETSYVPPSPPPREEAANADGADTEFDAKLSELQAKKLKAAEDEEYEVADATKQEIAALRKSEAARLRGLKSKAIEGEDFREAKRLKARLAKVDL